MPVALHQPSVYALFDALDAPLLTFGVSGAVTYANPAAREHPGRPVESMGGNAVVKSLIADAVLGKLKLPYKADVELADRHRLSGQFMPGPAGLDIAFLGISPAAVGAARGQVDLRDAMSLLRDELAPPLKQFHAQLNLLPRGPATAALEHAEQELVRRLNRLGDMISVFGDELLNFDDRIELQPLLRELCDGIVRSHTNAAVRFVLVDPAQTLPPIYGNARLIRSALHECLLNALVHSRREVAVRAAVSVEIRFTLSGEHVLLAVRNRGVTPVRVAGAAQLPPFVARPPQSPAGSAPRLGLPLVQRIVALHGGSMRLSPLGEDTVQMLLELPTGAPHRGNARLDIEQAQRYAQDLVKLLARRKQKETS